MIPRIPLHASSFRIFRGYKKPDLAETAFLKDLGETFMPGTPLMLRDLGLAAYLPSVLPVTTAVADVPDEVAIIAYPSPEGYAWARNNTIVGRMYTNTHLAVFDMAKSRSVFPVAIGSTIDPIHVFYLFGTWCDWQTDGAVVCWAGHMRHGEEPFAPSFMTELQAISAELRDVGVLECVGQATSTWASLWLLLNTRDSQVPDPLRNLLTQGLPTSTGLLLQTAERHIWRDAVPSVVANRASSHSFVFVRDARHFLR